jgi:hypothetical protein
MATASFYIYYRVRADRKEAARGLADRLIAAIEHRFGIHGRVLMRRDEPLLWMEIYEAVPDARAFEAAIAAECERLDFASALLPGSSRHCECFVEPARCA